MFACYSNKVIFSNDLIWFRYEIAFLLEYNELIFLKFYFLWK